VFFRLKILDFCRDFYGTVCRIEQCDGRDAALASLDGVPKFRGGLANRGYRAHASNNNSSSVHKRMYSLLSLIFFSKDSFFDVLFFLKLKSWLEISKFVRFL
jgi:hypothetical protein